MGARYDSFKSAGIGPVEYTGNGTAIPEASASQGFSMGAGAAGTTAIKPQP